MAITVTRAEVNRLSHLTTEELKERLAKIEENGRKAKAKIGHFSDAPAGYVMQRAARRVCSEMETTYNVCRRAWAVTKVALEERVA